MVTLYNKLLFLPRKSKREFIHKNRTMKTSVKFILMFVLLMLSFSISGNALNIMECSHNPVTSCQVSSSSLDANYSYRCGSDFAGFDKSQTLSVSDVSSMRRHKALAPVCSATLTAAVQVLYEIRQIEGILLFCQKQRSIILPVDDPVDNPDILAVRNHHIRSACGCDGGSSQLG